MAIRPQTGGSGAIRYEDFQPISELKEEEGANVLLVHLPGFEKEQIKVTYVYTTRIIRILGEQPLGNDKWSRFNQAFPVPQNCKVSEMRCNLQSGILTITMPKEIITQVGPKDEAKTTQEAPIPAKATDQPKPLKGQQETAPQAASTTEIQKPKDGRRLPSQSPQKAATEPKTQMGQEVTSPKATSSIPSVQTDGKRIDAFSPLKATKEPKSGKGQVETLPTVASPTSNLKQIDEKSSVPKDENVNQKTAKKEKSEEKDKPAESKKPENVMEKDSKEKSSEFQMAKSAAPTKILDKEKEEIDKSAGAGKKKRKDDSIAAKAKEIKSVAASAKKAVQEFAMELNEERQAMVNMGVAVLVIVALGAYIYFGSPGTVKD